MGWDDFGAHGNPKFTPCSTTLAPCRTKCTRSSRRRG
jgi:hypothetical protein